MDRRGFSTGQALRFGWDMTFANLRPLLTLGIVGGILALLQSALSEPGRAAGLRGLFSLAINVVQIGLSMVWARTCLRLRAGQSADLPNWNEVLPLFWSYLLTAVLFGIVVSIGLVLLIVPGIIWMLEFGFAGFIVVDKGVNPIDAFRVSRRLTMGAKGGLFLFFLALIGINLLGAIALGIGLLITVPVSMLAAADVYERLQAHAGERIEPPVRTAPMGPPAPA